MRLSSPAPTGSPIFAMNSGDSENPSITSPLARTTAEEVDRRLQPARVGIAVEDVVVHERVTNARLSSAPYRRVNSGEPANASEMSTRLERFRLQRSTQNARPAGSGWRRKYAR